MTSRLLDMIRTSLESLEELGRISLKRALPVEEQQVLPAGAAGTIVAVLKEGVAYLVEFTKPFAALVEIEIDDLEAIPGESRNDLLAGRMARRAQ